MKENSILKVILIALVAIIAVQLAFPPDHRSVVIVLQRDSQVQAQRELDERVKQLEEKLEEIKESAVEPSPTTVVEHGRGGDPASSSTQYAAFDENITMVFSDDGFGVLIPQLIIVQPCNGLTGQLSGSLYVYEAGGAAQSGKTTPEWAAITDKLLEDPRIDYATLDGSGMHAYFMFPEKGGVWSEADARSLADQLDRLIGWYKPCG